MAIAILIIICLTNLALGLFVYLRDRRADYTLAFFGTTILTCVWILSSYITEQHGIDLAVNDTANRVAYVAGFSVVFAGLLFTYTFPVKRHVSRAERVWLGALAVVGIVFSGTTYVSGHVTLSEAGNLTFSFGPLIALYVAAFLGVLVLIGRNLLMLPRRVDVSRRLQAKMVLSAFAITAFAGLVLSVIIPIYSQEWHTAQYAPFVTIFLIGMIVYTIVRHGLFDVRLAIVRTVTYVLTLMTLAVIYYLTALTISTFFLADQKLVNPIGIALAIILAFIFQPIKHFFDRITSRLFYKDNYNADDFFTKLNHSLNSTTDLRSLLQRAGHIIASTLKAEHAVFIVKHPNSRRHITVGTAEKVNFPATDVAILENYFKVSSSPLMRAELESTNPLFRLLVSHRFEIVKPLFQNDEIVGMLCLGEHRTSRYSLRDLHVLRVISDELIIAIQNALSVEQIKELNANLEQRVDAATRELRASNAQLQKLDEAKDEFISMASHQLRTPLTSIKGYISMLMEGDVGKISPEQKHLLREAFISSERMVRLIGDFLNVSRLQTGKFVIEKRPVDLALLVHRELEALDPNATARGLKFSYVKPKNIPKMNLDENKIQQVIMNFADNAIYYSKETSLIKVSLKLTKGIVEFTVKDSGIGVPKAQQDQLFNKFFRATNARLQRPDGTGVGLFLAKKVIDAHHGKIIFESKEDKGSTFGFSLPIEKLRAD